MAVQWISDPNYCRAISVTFLVFGVHLFIVGSHVGNCSGVTDEGWRVGASAVTGATFAPPTQAPTIGPPPPATVGPQPPATIAPPPAGNLCGTQESNSYSLTTLITPPYWTLNRLGACFDTYGQPSFGCEFRFAFCKYLPLEAGQKQGVGASQVSTQPGSQRVKLGGKSAVVQLLTNGEPTELLVSFENGNTTTCGTLHVELHLRCNKDAVWPIPISGSPATLPDDTTVSLDLTTCKYTVETDYSGACSTAASGLSAGTILIILFLCAVTLYLIGGVAYNMFSGARGLELIPNYEVWKNFPSDVMGGIKFVFGIISCQKESKSEEYDNI